PNSESDEAILANDAPPKDVDGIERDHLDLWELHSGAEPDHTPRKLVGSSRRKREPCRVPEPRVEERIAPDLRQDLIKVEEQRGLDADPQTSPDLGFERGPPRRLGPLRQRIVDPQCGAGLLRQDRDNQMAELISAEG